MAPASSSERFGRIRAEPPPLPTRPGWASAPWTATPLGEEGAFPNGGLWRFSSPVGSMVVKRTGAAYLGGDPVWRLSVDETDPSWWGREAAFYGSDLATSGWDGGCGPAECLAIDRRPDEADLWLEDVEVIPLPLSRYRDAVAGFARWQARHRASVSPVLSHGWIAQHVGRRRLDARSTAAHPGWAALAAAGISDDVRRWVEIRVTDAAMADAVLGALPQVATHHDLHPMNLGVDGSRIAIIDWATVGWGPVGHDVATLVLDRGSDGDLDVAELWAELVGHYGRQLRAAGLDLDQSVIERSATVSATIRMGWLPDLLLESSRTAPPSETAGLVAVTNFLASLAVVDPL